MSFSPHCVNERVIEKTLHDNAGRESKEKNLDDWNKPDWLKTYQRTARDELVWGGSGCREWRMITAEGAKPQESDMQSQPSKKRNGDAPLGYSGWTALTREHCNVDDEALLGNDPVMQQWKGGNCCYAMAQYRGVNNGLKDVFCGRCGGYITEWQQ
jgi:hypothetical protein